MQKLMIHKLQGEKTHERVRHYVDHGKIQLMRFDLQKKT
jgi:hypothetical protein